MMGALLGRAVDIGVHNLVFYHNIAALGPICELSAGRKPPSIYSILTTGATLLASRDFRRRR